MLMVFMKMVTNITEGVFLFFYYFFLNHAHDLERELLGCSLMTMNRAIQAP